MNDPAKVPFKLSKQVRGRGKGGFIRSNWQELNQLIAAANVWTIKHLRPGSCCRFLADPGDVDGFLRRRNTLSFTD
ncbi:molybdopterin-dependent oxidoreductase [Escherichia coli]|nr:molybdopterin-dependent oxidoreductase [Escherichia coli]